MLPGSSESVMPLIFSSLSAFIGYRIGAVSWGKEKIQWYPCMRKGGSFAHSILGILEVSAAKGPRVLRLGTWLVVAGLCEVFVISESVERSASSTCINDCGPAYGV